MPASVAQRSNATDSFIGCALRTGAEAEPLLRLKAPSLRFPPRVAGLLLTSDLETALK